MKLRFVVLVLSLILCVSSRPSNNRNNDLDLKLVHVVSKNEVEFSELFAVLWMKTCSLTWLTWVDVIENQKLLWFQIFRHGARTPADTYPNDPFINHSMEPYGWGQLTNVSEKWLNFYQKQIWTFADFETDRKIANVRQRKIFESSIQWLPRK